MLYESPHHHHHPTPHPGAWSLVGLQPPGTLQMAGGTTTASESQAAHNLMLYLSGLFDIFWWKGHLTHKGKRHSLRITLGLGVVQQGQLFNLPTPNIPNSCQFIPFPYLSSCLTVLWYEMFLKDTVEGSPYFIWIPIRVTEQALYRTSETN